MALPVSDARGAKCKLLWFTITVLVSVGALGCRRALPVVGPGAPGAQSKVTISGTVRGPERTIAVDNRIVELVNLTTSERTRVATNEDGGYAVRVQPGDYRVELRLREGEALVRQPGIIHVSRAGGDADGDFVVGSVSTRVVRPRSPVYRTDDGLGSPVT